MLVADVHTHHLSNAVSNAVYVFTNGDKLPDNEFNWTLSLIQMVN